MRLDEHRPWILRRVKRWGGLVADYAEQPAVAELAVVASNPFAFGIVEPQKVEADHVGRTAVGEVEREKTLCGIVGT